MKKFKYDHHPAVYALLSIILIATVIGCYFSASGLIFSNATHKTVAYAVLIVINVFLFITVLSALLYSRYIFKDRKIIVRLGFIRWTYDVEDVAAVTHLIDVKKLLVTFKDGKYIFAVVSPSNMEDFANEIRKISPEAVFDVNYVAPKKNQ